MYVIQQLNTLGTLDDCHYGSAQFELSEHIEKGQNTEKIHKAGYKVKTSQG